MFSDLLCGYFMQLIMSVFLIANMMHMLFIVISPIKAFKFLVLNTLPSVPAIEL